MMRFSGIRLRSFRILSRESFTLIFTLLFIVIIFYLNNSSEIASSTHDVSRISERNLSPLDITVNIDSAVESAKNTIEASEDIFLIISKGTDLTDVEKNLKDSIFFARIDYNIRYTPGYDDKCDVLYLANNFFIFYLCLDLQKNKFVKEYSGVKVKKTKADLIMNGRASNVR